MSLDTIHQEMLEGIPEHYQKTVGCPTWDFTRAFAIGADELQADLAEEAKKLDVDNLEGDELTRFVFQRKGITRRAATYAIGTLYVEGTGTVQEGDLFASQGGIRFMATETVTINGSGYVPIRAVNAGSSGNLPPGVITEIPVTIAGIVSVTNPEATTDGYEEESDEDLRARYYTALPDPATCGNAAHYHQWALEVSGVGDAKVFPLGHGNWTVDVVIIDAEHDAADDELVGRVQEYIDPESAGLGLGKAPIGAHCYVESAETVPLTVDVTVTLMAGITADSVSQDIQNAIKAYLVGIAFQQLYVSYAKISDAISGVAGVADHEGLLVNGGTQNVAVTERQVAVLGEVIINVAG